MKTPWFRFWFLLGASDDQISSYRSRIVVSGTYTGWIFASMLAVSQEAAIAQSYTFTTAAGQPGTSGSNDGLGGQAQFYAPRGVAVAPNSGNVFVVDSGNHTIRKVTPDGEVTTFAGLAGTSGTANGTGSNARFNSPTGIAIDWNGDLYVTDTGNHTIRKITASAVVTTIAGVAGSPGATDGANAVARFRSPDGIATDAGGNLYIGDAGNHTVRKLAADTVSTLAGLALATGSTDGTGSTARFYYPKGVAVDAQGNVFVADSFNNTIRKVTALGEVTTLAGTANPVGGYADGSGGDARFNFPQRIAVDAVGNIVVADMSNNRIRRVTPGGVVTTLAGSSAGFADGTGDQARFYWPSAISVDLSGPLYVVEEWNATLRLGVLLGIAAQPQGTAVWVGATATFQVTANGAAPISFQWLKNGTNIQGAVQVSYTINNAQPSDAGNYSVQVSNESGTITSSNATLIVNEPVLIVHQPENQTVLKGTPVTLSMFFTGGTGPFEFKWYKNNLPDLYFNYLAENVTNRYLGNVTPSQAGTYYLEIIQPAGSTTTSNAVLVVQEPILFTSQPQGRNAAHGESVPLSVGFTGSGPFSYQWNKDGVPIYGATNEVFMLTNSHPAESGVYTITISQPAQTVTSEGASVRVTVPYTYSTLAGQPEVFGSTNGQGTAALFYYPEGIAVDGGGTVYVADSQNHAIRRIAEDGTVTTVAGSLLHSGSVDGVGDAARFDIPWGVAVDSENNLYVADTGNHTIRKVTSGGVVTTLAGLAGNPGEADGTGAVARFRYPSGIAVDSGGNLFVADRENHTIRKVSGSGQVTTLAGSPGNSGSIDGVGMYARFNWPVGIAVDRSGSLYVGDTRNYTIRKITPDGEVTTLAGVADHIVGSDDGVGNTARFFEPRGLSIDSVGNIYVADNGNQIIRKVTSSGLVTTIGGEAGMVGSVDGIGSGARFAWPNALAVDSVGNLYIADALNHIIRKGTPQTIAPYILNSNSSRLVQGGSNLVYSALVDGTGPFSYQWLYNGSPLQGQTSSTLSLASSQRTNSGDYGLYVSGPGGSSSNTVVHLRVTFPTVLLAPQVLSDKTICFYIRYSDLEPISADDLYRFRLFSAPEVAAPEAQWTTITVGLSVTNGMLYYKSTPDDASPTRFFRVAEGLLSQTPP